MRQRRASRNVTLVLIGTAALAGCGPAPQKMARDHYATLEDCTADWGRPEACDRVQSSGYPGGYIYRGPLYMFDSRDAARRDVMSDAERAGRASLVDRSRQGRSIGTSVEPTTRGGFGSSARSYSSIGS
jgi:uncharacterized protein YgiB involved in biofilm formation